MNNTIAITDPEYPKNLLNIYDPPENLYIKGSFLSQDSKSIAIVGTRKPTHYGLSVAKKLAYELASLGITIVSGLALGVDTEAHKGALEANGRTIAVIGTGLNIIYPPENAQLTDQIISSGAVVSELTPDTAPANWTFPRRNRIISGLSVGVIVIEGGYKSGAMITAKLALEQGREVFAVPGNIESENSKGPHWLIKQGAKLTENIDDVLDELTHLINIPSSERKINPAKEIDYSAITLEEQLVLKQISREPISVDKISYLSGLEISKILVLISQLEIKRFIKRLAGNTFVLC